MVKAEWKVSEERDEFGNVLIDSDTCDSCWEPVPDGMEPSKVLLSKTAASGGTYFVSLCLRCALADGLVGPWDVMVGGTRRITLYHWDNVVTSFRSYARDRHVVSIHAGRRDV